MAEEVTVGQVIEFVNKNAREQTALLEQIQKGEIARSQLQQMITKSKRSPQERLARSLLKKAQTPSIILFKYGYSSSPISAAAFAEIAAVYELLGESEMADKIAYHGTNDSWIQLQRIKALCEKDNLERARELARTLIEDSRSLAWAAIAEKSQSESDYDQIKSTNFAVKLAVAVSRAKTDQSKTLAEMRAQTVLEKYEHNQIQMAMAKEYARQKRFEASRETINQLAHSVHEQLEAAHILARVSKDPKDIALYRVLIIGISPESKLSSVIQHLAQIAAITGDEQDFIACQEAINQILSRIVPVVQYQSIPYSALALAYAERGDIATARKIVNKKIVASDIEAVTYAKMARIVLSQPD